MWRTPSWRVRVTLFSWRRRICPLWLAACLGDAGEYHCQNCYYDENCCHISILSSFLHCKYRQNSANLQARIPIFSWEIPIFAACKRAYYFELVRIAIPVEQSSGIFRIFAEKLKGYECILSLSPAFRLLRRRIPSSGGHAGSLGKGKKD